MKTGLVGALGIVEHEFGSAKHETGLDALGTADNVS
jgi:hypothetical protein